MLRFIKLLARCKKEDFIFVTTHNVDTEKVFTYLKNEYVDINMGKT